MQFRVSESQLEYISRTFYEYILYGVEYVLFWNYHAKGTNNKVFSLSMKD